MSFNLGTASGRIVVDGSGASQGFSVARGAANVFFQAIDRKVESVRNLGDRLTKVGATGVAGFGLAVKAASGFEAQMSAVKAVSGASTDQMERLRAKAMQLGKDTAFSASEAGAAMEELVKAGISTEDVLNGAADATVALAAAGQISLPEAATIASNAMNQFGLSAKEMPKIADLIAGAANSSAIDVTDFGFSLSQAGAVANLTGMSFDDLSVAIAEMGNAGIKGSDAGTSLKTFLSNLIPTTDQQVKKFQELGLYTVNLGDHMKDLAAKGIKPVSGSFDDVVDALGKYIDRTGGAKEGTAKNRRAALELGQQMGVLNNAFFDSNGKLKSLREVQDILNKSTKDLTKEQKLHTLETLFGSDAIRAAAVLSKEGAKGYDEMAKSIGKVKAADVAATRLDNLKGSVEQLKGSFETAMITIGNVFLPIVRKMVDAATWLINVFNNLPAPIQTALTAVFGIGSAFALAAGLAIKLAFILGPLLARFLGFRLLSSVFSIFTTGFRVWRSGAGAAAALAAAGGRVATLFGSLVRGIRFFITWGGRFIAMSRLMGAAWAFITGPWGIAIAAIIALAVLLYNKWKPFRDLVNQIGAYLKGAFLTAVQYLKDAWQQLVQGFEDGTAKGQGFFGFMQQLGAGLRTVWERLQELWVVFQEKMLPALIEFGKKIQSVASDNLKSIWSTIQTQLIPAFQGLWNTIQTQILPALQGLWDVIGPGVIIIGKVIGAILYFSMMLQMGIVKVIIGYVIPAMLQFSAIIFEVVVVALTWIIKIIVAVVAAIVTFVGWIINGLGAAFTWIGNLATTVWNAILAVITTVWNAIWSFVQPIVQAIWNFIVMAWNTIKAVVVGAVQAIWSVIQSVWNLFYPLISAVLDLILAVVRLVWTAVVFVVMSAVMAIWNGIKSAWNGIKSTTSTVWNGIKAFFSALWNGLKALATSAANGIKSAVSSAWNGIKAITSSVWNGIKALTRTVWNGIKAFLTGLMNGIKSMFSSAWNGINSMTGGKVRAIFNSVKNGLSSLGRTITGYFRSAYNGAKTQINNLISIVRRIPGRVRSAIGNLGSLLYNAGKSIIKGLINGITSMIGSLTSKLNSITNKIPDWKGPIKRDKVLLTENGKIIMQGLIKGFKAEEPGVEAALRQLTSSLPSWVEGAYVGPHGKGLTRPTTDARDYSSRRESKFTTIINNPVAERASNSVAKRLRTLSSAGVI